MYKIIERYLTPNKYSRPKLKINKIKAIAIHWVSNPMSSAMANRNFFESLKNQTSKYCSAHEIIDLNGSVVICVPKDEVAYHAGSKTYTTKAWNIFENLNEYTPNYYSYGIECTHLDWDGNFTKETYNTLVERCVDLCIEFNLNPLTNILTHHEIVGWKDCPRYFTNNPNAWDEFKQLVKSKLEQRVNEMYNDEDKIAKWAFENVKKAKELGLMIGDNDGNFNPKDVVTREQLATVIINLYNKLKG